jgi:hypothetical protein
LTVWSPKNSKKIAKNHKFHPNPSIYTPTRVELIPHTIPSHFSLPNYHVILF